MNFELHTKRLTLRPMSPGDVLELHELWTSAGVRRHLWDDEIIPLERTRAIVEESEALFRAHGYGLWAARHTATNTLIAFAGFWYFRQAHELELLYGVNENNWRQGYAVEAARAVVDYGLGTLAMKCVRASTDEGHLASVRVLEKLGFTPAGRRVVDGLDTRFYLLER